MGQQGKVVPCSESVGVAEDYLVRRMGKWRGLAVFPIDGDCDVQTILKIVQFRIDAAT